MKFENVLLIQPMHEKTNKARRTSIHFPWGLAYLATYMKQAGYNVKVLDGQALQLPKEDLAPKIDLRAVDVVGISAFSTQYAAVEYLSQYIKSIKNIPVILGGPLATYQAELVLKRASVDICVIGDGEFSGIEVLKHYDELEHVEGIAYKREGEIFVTSPQGKLIDLDDLPIPDFSLFNMPVYLNQKNSFSGERAKGQAITFITSRGCPYSCHFCSKSSKTYRSMSPQRIHESLRFLKRDLGVEEVSFNDELFLSSKKRFAEVGPLIRKLGLAWGAQARVNLMDEEFLDMAKDFGCNGLGYGIESGSQKILDNMNKKISVRQIEDAMRYTRQRGIPVKVQLIFGYPGEDETTVEETIDLFRRVDHPGRRFVVITPVPGSKLYEDCVAQGLIRDEVQYLYSIEKSFGAGKVLVNFTQWPDEEIYPRKLAAERKMMRNYVQNSNLRKIKYFLLGKWSRL